MDPVTLLTLALFFVMVIAWVALPGSGKTGIEEQDMPVGVAAAPSSSAQ